jgi:hypothetical protein
MAGALNYRFEARYGGVPLLVESWETNRSRNLIVHLPARGKGAQLSDRGGVPREDTLTVRLVGTAAAVTSARDQLIALQDTATAATFQHPLDGSWPARLSDFTERVDANGPVYTLKLTHDAQAEQRAIQSVRQGQGSERDVAAAVAIYETDKAALAEDEPETAAALVAGDELRDPVRAWATAPATQVELDAQHQREQISASTATLDGLLSPEAHETALALLQVQASLDSYRRTLRQFSPTLAAIVVPSDRPLVRILTDLYGAARADELLDDVIRSNSITDPLRVRAGTTLQLPPL